MTTDVSKRQVTCKQKKRGEEKSEHLPTNETELGFELELNYATWHLPGSAESNQKKKEKPKNRLALLLLFEIRLILSVVSGLRCKYSCCCA